MLTLNRKTETSLIIGDDVKITVTQVHVRNQEVTFEIDAPDYIKVQLSEEFDLERKVK